MELTSSRREVSAEGSGRVCPHGAPPADGPHARRTCVDNRGRRSYCAEGRTHLCLGYTLLPPGYVLACDSEHLRSPESPRPVSTVPHRIAGRWRESRCRPGAALAPHSRGPRSKAISAPKSTTVARCMIATAWRASLSPRCWSTRLNTSKIPAWGRRATPCLRWARKVRGVWTVGKILQPRAGIDDIHTRSASRSTFVSIPFRKPFISRTGRAGMNSMRSP